MAIRRRVGASSSLYCGAGAMTRQHLMEAMDAALSTVSFIDSRSLFERAGDQQSWGR